MNELKTMFVVIVVACSIVLIGVVISNVTSHYYNNNTTVSDMELNSISKILQENKDNPELQSYVSSIIEDNKITIDEYNGLKKILNNISLNRIKEKVSK